MKEHIEVNLDTIMSKLEKAHLVQKEPSGSMTGIFSIKNHGHLLTEEELKTWLYILHQGSAHDDQKCSDLHQWRFDVTH